MIVAPAVSVRKVIRSADVLTDKRSNKIYKKNIYQAGVCGGVGLQYHSCCKIQIHTDGIIYYNIIYIYIYIYNILYTVYVARGDRKEDLFQIKIH